MKLLLDVHFSNKKVGDPLRSEGHDVVAAQSDEGLKRLGDEPLLEWALPPRRIIVTGNVQDFAPIVYSRQSRNLPHAGCILVPGNVKNHHHGRVLSGVRQLLEEFPSQKEWWNLVMWLPQGIG